MIDLNDVLLTMSNIPVDDPIAEIWGRGLQSGYKIIEYTGSLPITIRANGDALLDYRIYGSTVQSGTPTPENPIMTIGCGVRTENLLNLNRTYFNSFTTDTTKWMNGAATLNNAGTIYAETKIIGDTIKVTSKQPGYGASFLIKASPNTTYTVSFETDKTSSGSWGGISDRDINGTVINAAAIYGKSATFTTHDNCAFLNVCFRFPLADGTVTFSNIMLIEGSTALPYEPYGYKLPMKSGAPTIYGFHINPDESDSYNCVTYLNDAVGMTPASMGSTAFNYGSWEKAFFMPRPCMLKLDGTVDYYLDPNDYSKKADGTPSDYNNLAYGGNAMMEFPLIWYKFVPGVAEGEGYFYCSNHKVDNTYKCWSNMDCDGNIIDHFYMPIYNGCTYDGKMRSISGLTLASWNTTAYSASATYAVDDVVNYQGKMWKCITAVETAEAFDPEKWEQFAFNGNTSGQEEIAQATANNTTDKTEWYIDMWCDRVLINALLVLIAKSIDTQGKFGRGIDSGDQTAKESYVTGSLDDKGLFYGSTASRSSAVKVFGMENWWSLAWRRTAGLFGGTNDTYLYKMTFSTADGSTATAYNTNGSGYLSVSGRLASNWLMKEQFGLFGMLPVATGSYSSLYYKDYFYTGTGFARVGGSSAIGSYDGAFSVSLYYGAGYRYWHITAAPSCKPLREKFSDKSGNAASLATTTPVYIGENQLDSVEGVSDYVDKSSGKIVRMIGEYTFTGDESFNKYGNSDVFYTSTTIDPVGITTVNTITMRCNHPAFTAIENKDTRYWLNPEADDICCFLPGGRSQVFLRSTSNFATAAECKAYLKAQYDNDTPVKISYWLKTPVEEDPPVPFPDIPTIKGETIIDYDGDPKPSQMYVKYKDKE